MIFEQLGNALYEGFKDAVPVINTKDVPNVGIEPADLGVFEVQPIEENAVIIASSSCQPMMGD